jgi:hypothetical protein
MVRIGARGGKVNLGLVICFVAVGGWAWPGRADDEAASSGDPVVRRIEPAEEGFFSKVTECRGIPIKAHEDVADEALVEASRRLERLLGNQPVVVENLTSARVELHVIGKDQVTSDLPDHRRWKGKPYDGEQTIDQRTRGVGGRHASCGEENLLALGKDRYRGRDICSHEFAHTLRNFGLDRETRKRFDDQYRKARDAGLWKGMYAGSNADEYFAELTMWYVGTRGDYGSLMPPPEPGPEWLKGYDPEGFALLDELYSGRMTVAKRERRRSEAPE